MKKTLKISGIVIGVLLLMMLALPFVFQGKIKEIATSQANKMLNAQVAFNDLSISLFRNFPNAAVTIKEMTVVGVDNFEADTLANVGEFTAVVNLMSLISGDYEINKLLLENTSLNAIVDTSGRANWDIMKADTTIQSESVSKTEEPAKFDLELKRLIVKNLNIKYVDHQNPMSAQVQNLNLICRGDFGADKSMVKLETEIEKLSVSQGMIPYLKNCKIYGKIDVDADFEHDTYTLKNNILRLNAIEASIDGGVKILEDEGGYDMDLRLATNKIGFREILSLIPAIYAKDFDQLKADGNVSLEAFVKGVMQGETLPPFALRMKVDNGMFKYANLPQSVDKITLDAAVDNPGGSADKTTIKIEPLSFVLAGNPFSLSCSVATPVSDPDIKVEAKGVINLGMVKEVYPLDSTELSGTLTADLKIAGKLSLLEKERYDQFVANGTLHLSDMTLKMADMPDVKIKKSLFTFTPRYLNLSETTVNIGRSDISTTCRLENYLGFALKNETIRGNLDINSKLLNLNELMNNTQQNTASVDTTAAMGVFEVPRNIDFKMNTRISELLYDKFELKNVAGNVTVKEGKLDMTNLSMNLLGGSVVANGYYSTAVSRTNPVMNAAFKMNELSFAESFKTLEMIQKLAPIFEHLKGTYSGNMNLAMTLDSTMSPITSSINGSGSLNTHDLSLSGIAVLDKIADAVKNEKLKNVTAKDLKIDFTVVNGNLITKPFDIKLGDTKLTLSGSTSLDQKIDYKGRVQLPSVLGKLSTLDLLIGGTFSSPTVSVDTKSMVDQVVNSVKEKALEDLGNKLGIDLSNAEKQKEALVKTAEKMGAQLVEEAQKQADALLEKAGNNPLAKMGAKKAGTKLVEEAEKEAAKMVEKANADGDKLIEKVKIKQQ